MRLGGRVVRVLRSGIQDIDNKDVLGQILACDVTLRASLLGHYGPHGACLRRDSIDRSKRTGLDSLADLTAFLPCFSVIDRVYHKRYTKTKVMHPSNGLFRNYGPRTDPLRLQVNAFLM